MVKFLKVNDAFTLDAGHYGFSADLFDLRLHALLRTSVWTKFLCAGYGGNSSNLLGLLVSFCCGGFDNYWSVAAEFFVEAWNAIFVETMVLWRVDFVIWLGATGPMILERRYAVMKFPARGSGADELLFVQGPTRLYGRHLPPFLLLRSGFSMMVCRYGSGLCYRAAWRRLGEALNPGPRRHGPPRTFSLESVHTVSATTLRLEARLLAEFFEWGRRRSGSATFEEIFHLVPLFLPQCLRAYGDELFQRGGSLFNLRHLFLAAQRWCPAARVHMQAAWEIVERWELQCPVTHRAPIPEVLVKAMVSCAWQRRWYAWVGITLLAFYGAGRLGEVICCNREDLLLPRDLCDDAAAAFLRLRKFKSIFRQPARVQHMRVGDEYALLLLDRIFGSLALDSPLFPGSPYQYRLRWNLLLSDFGIEKTHGLTPGGLRGGSAVYHYRAGRPIADLLWLMRLRSQTTLESYLQEVAALNVLGSLPEHSRSTILAFAATFPLLKFATGAQGYDNR
eukprot:s1133_g20.t1